MKTFPAITLMLVCGIPAVLCVDGNGSLSNSSSWMYLWGTAVVVGIFGLFLFCLKDDPTVEIQESYTVTMGEKVELTWSTSAFPFIKSVSWQHISPEGQTKQLDIDQQKYAKSKQRTHLIIKKTSKSDEGEYVCTVSDWCGRRRSATTEVMVEGGPPKLNMNPLIHKKTEGDAVVLQCKVVATPSPSTATWTKTGDRNSIAIDNDKYYMGSLQSPALIINNMNKIQDEGEYTCEARNIAGPGRNSVHLIIDSKTSNPITRKTTDIKRNAPTEEDMVHRRILLIHRNMVVRLAKYFFPAARYWKEFLTGVALYLYPLELQGDLYDIVANLLRMEHIDYGQYMNLYDIVNEIEVAASRIIKEAELEIKEMRKRGTYVLNETPAEVRSKFEGNLNPKLLDHLMSDVPEKFPDVEGRLAVKADQGSIVLTFTISEAKTPHQLSALYLAVTLGTRLQNGKILLTDESHVPLILKTTPTVRIPTDNSKDILTVRLSRRHYQFEEGKDAILKCVVVGPLETRYIKWFTVKDDGNFHDIFIDNKKYFCGSPKSPSLVISDLNKEDRGIYFCRVGHTEGEEESNMAVVEINVTDDVSTVKESVSTMKENVSTVKEDVSTVKEDVSTVKEDISTVKEPVSIVKEDVSIVKEDVSTVKEDVSTVKEDVSTVKEDVSTVKKDVGTVKEDVSIVKEDVSIVKEDVSTVKEPVSTMKEDVSTVKEDVSIVKEDVSIVKEDVSTVKEDVSTVKEDVGTVKGDVSTVKEDVSTVKEDVSTVKGDVSTVKEDVSTVKEDVSTVKEDVCTMKGDVSTVKEDVSTLKGDVSTLKEDVSIVKEDVSTVKEDVSTVKEDVSSVKDDVSTVKEDVSTVKEDVSTVKEDVSTVKRDVSTVKDKFSFTIKKIHADMVIALSKKFGPDIKPEKPWKELLELLSPILEPADLQGNIMDICKCLMARGKIRHGSYEELIEVVKKVDVTAAGIIRKAAEKIQAVQSEGPSQAERQRTDRDEGNKKDPRITAMIGQTEAMKSLSKLEDGKFYALLYLFLNGGEVMEDDLDPKNENIDETLLEVAFAVDVVKVTQKDEFKTKERKLKFVKESLDCLLGWLVKKESVRKRGSEKYYPGYKFNHDSIEETVALLYGEKTPIGYIQNCPVKSLSYVTTSKTTPNRIVISSDGQTNAMYKRLVREFKSLYHGPYRHYRYDPFDDRYNRYRPITSLDVWTDTQFLQGFIRWLSGQNVDKNLCHQIKLELLNEACSSGAEECALYLLSEGVKPDEETPFCVVEGRSVNVLKNLNDEIKLELLNKACSSGAEECALYLLSEGVEPDKYTPFCVVKGGSVNLLHKLLEYDVTPTARAERSRSSHLTDDINVLHEACLCEREEMVTVLCDKYPHLVHDTDKYRQSTLYFVARTGNCGIFHTVERTALKSLCRVEDEQHKCETVDGRVVHRSCVCAQYMSQLVDGEGMTVLHGSCMRGHREMSLYICESFPALTTVVDEDGYHCLHYIAWFTTDVDLFTECETHVKRYLESTGREYDITAILNNRGESVLDLAKDWAKYLRTENNPLYDHLVRLFSKH